MAKLGTTFKATEHDTEQRDYEDLPAGVYDFEIETSEIVETGPENARTGSGLKYAVSVLAPESVAGRKFFGFINLENRNPQAQEIGQKEFASLCRAIGVDEVDDSEELHFRSYRVKLGMGKPSKKTNPDGTPQYPARMEVKKYFFPDQGEMPEPEVEARAASNDNRPTPKPANENRAAPPAKVEAGKARPWGKK